MSNRLKYPPLPGPKMSTVGVIIFLVIVASLMMLDVVAVVYACMQVNA